MTLSVLQAITPSLREAVSAIARGDRKGMFQLNLSSGVSDQVRHKPGCIATEDGWLEA